MEGVGCGRGWGGVDWWRGWGGEGSGLVQPLLLAAVRFGAVEGFSQQLCAFSGDVEGRGSPGESVGEHHVRHVTAPGHLLRYWSRSVNYCCCL